MPPKPFKAIYVLHGDDEYTRDENRRRIVREVIGDADPQLAVCSHDAKRKGGSSSSEDDTQSPAGPAQSDPLLAEVLDDLTTLPLMAASRLVIVRDADDFVASNHKALAGYLEKPCPTGALLLLMRSWPGRIGTSAFVARVSSIGQAVDCSVPKGVDLDRWVRQAAEKRGNSIGPQAAGLLASLVGADLAALDSEVEKLSLYAGQGAAITAEHVHLLTASTAGAEDFGLVNAIAASDAKAALAVLDKELTRRGEEFRMLGQIGWYLRTVIHAQTLRQAGQDPSQALRVKYEARQTYLDLIRRRSLRKLQADCRRVLAADLALKSGAAPHGTMQDLILALCA